MATHWCLVCGRYVEKPQLWSLDKQPTGNWTCTYVQDLPEGLYRKEKVRHICTGTGRTAAHICAGTQVEGELNSVSHGSGTTNALKSAKIWLNIVKARTHARMHERTYSRTQLT